MTRHAAPNKYPNYTLKIPLTQEFRLKITQNTSIIVSALQYVNQVYIYGTHYNDSLLTRSCA